MEEEVNSLKDNNTYDLVKKTKNMEIIPTKWVYTLKKDENGNVVRFKARLVARGFAQSEETFNETYAPVLKAESFRIILAIAGTQNYKIKKYDIKSAFLNGDIDSEIFIHQPPTFEDNTSKVCRLNKALYGLKQAPLCWNRKLTETLRKHGFKQTISDNCVWLKENIIFGFHVDDFIVAYKNDFDIQEFLNALNIFEVKESNNNLLLGLNVEEKLDEIKISQTNLIENVIKLSKLEDANGIESPCITGEHLEKCIETNDNCKNFPYQTIIGKLNYLSTWTRPDITYAVNQAARFNNGYNDKHIKYVKRIIRYLKQTKNEGITVSRKYNKSSNLVLYSDADWGNSKNRKSTSGIIILLNDVPIIWKSKKQNAVAISTMEAEYYALAFGVTELLWCRKLLYELKINLNIPIIYEDNQSTIDNLLIGSNVTKAKHIDLKYNFVKDYYKKKYFQIKHCSSNLMIADMLTKPLGPQKFRNIKKVYKEVTT